jgi:hypothetical protein
MDLLDLRAEIRKEGNRRVAAKEITVSELARKSKVGQPSVSSFLDGTLNFSLPTLNALMHAMGMQIEQFHEKELSPAPGNYKSVPVVTQINAIEQPRITRSLALEIIRIPFTSPILQIDELDARLAWTRFVAVFVTRAQFSFMEPIFARDTLLVIDRHCHDIDERYQGLENIYAAADGKLLDIGYLHSANGRLQIHPHQHNPRLHVVTLPLHHTPQQHIVGRICKMLL